jgi:hypothetical protein
MLRLAPGRSGYELPDVYVPLRGKDVFVDVRLTCASTPGRVAGAGPVAEAVAAVLNSNESAKLAHYRRAGLFEPGAPFSRGLCVPFVMEIGGRFADGAAAFLRRLASALAGDDPAADRLSAAGTARLRAAQRDLVAVQQQHRVAIVMEAVAGLNYAAHPQRYPEGPSAALAYAHTLTPSCYVPAGLELVDSDPAGLELAGEG